MGTETNHELDVLILEFFGGDAAKTTLWFSTKNPLLGGIAPRKMIKAGRYEKLLGWAKQQLAENLAPAGMDAKRGNMKTCNKPAAFVVVGKSKGRGKTKRPEMVMSCPLHLGAITEQVVHLCYKASVEYGPSSVRCDHGMG